MGQGCPGTQPTPIRDGIAGGSYTGFIECVRDMTVYDLSGAVVASQDLGSPPSDITLAFVAGLPSTTSGTPVSPGDSKDVDLGPFSIYSVVDTAVVDDGRAVVVRDVLLSIEAEQRVELSGPETTIYTQDGDGLRVSSEMTLSSAVVDGEIAIFTESCIAHLR